MPVEHCSLQSHSPVQARMFLELASLPPDSSFIVSVGADVGACVVGAGGGACVDGAGIGACVVGIIVLLFGMICFVEGMPYIVLYCLTNVALRVVFSDVS